MDNKQLELFPTSLGLLRDTFNKFATSVYLHENRRPSDDTSFEMRLERIFLRDELIKLLEEYPL